MANNNLTLKQEKFCQAYLEKGNISDAYREAYDSENMKPGTINQKAFELFHNGEITVRLKQLQEKLQHISQISKERILYELDAILNSKISDYLEIKDGKIVLKDFEGLSDSQLRAIESIKDTKFGIEFKLHGKSWSTKRICEMLGYEQPRRLDLSSGGKKIKPLIVITSSEKDIDTVKESFSEAKSD